MCLRNAGVVVLAHEGGSKKVLDITKRIDLFSEGRVGALDRRRNAVKPGAMQVRRPHDMQDITKMVQLGSVMAAEGDYADIPYSEDKTRKLGVHILVDEDESTYFARIVECDGEIIAMMLAYVTEFYFSTARIAQDFLLYVHPDHRGSSAAVRLIKEFMRWTEDKDIVQEQLGITEGVNNEAVAKMYEKFGYKLAGYIYKRKVK